MSKYDVHIYREMKLYYPDIEAVSPIAAAQKARNKATSEAKDIGDADGVNLSALVDVQGDPDHGNSQVIDFEPQRLLNVSLKLLDALRTVVSMEYDRDEESRNFDNDRLEYFASLIAEAEGRSA